VLKIHIDEAILDANGAIDQYKIDLALAAIGILGSIKACLKSPSH
jgi:hypothetical protein